MGAANDKVILITGATDGLGKFVAGDLAAEGASIILHGRNKKKGEALIEEIQRETGNERLAFCEADFGSLHAVRKLAAEILTNHGRLDVLINNAGIGARSAGAPRELSEDGLELRFAVNYLAHFLLTLRLLPLIRQSTPSRIVNVSSIGQQAIDFNDVMLEHDYDDLRAYRQSKLAQVMFTIDLADRLAGTGVTVNALHPASLMNTNMVRDSDYFRGAITNVQEGADGVEYLAISPKVEKITGMYFERKKPSRANAQAYDKSARSRLWELSELITGEEFGKVEEQLKKIA